MSRDAVLSLPPLRLDDPWSLPPAERRRLYTGSPAAQARWLPRLAALVEPPAPDDSFPAFLLEAPRFAALRAAIAKASRARDLDTATADELQRFVDLVRGYLLEAEEAWRSPAVEVLDP